METSILEGTKISALIVAHGSPSQREGPEAAMSELARAVQARLPGWRVRGATLATPGSLAKAVAETSGRRSGPLRIYPHFMSDGWFVSDELPRRLVEAGAALAEVEVLRSFGLDPRIWALCARRAREGADRLGLEVEATTLVLAAHGSPADPRPAEATRKAARSIKLAQPFREIRLGFIDEPPFLEEAMRVEGPALCLPFFAGRAGHVRSDLPQAARAAGFEGPILAPIGTDPLVPEAIAESLATHQAAPAVAG